MHDARGYGQYCPIAMTAEILAERWTPLVVRSLCAGATRFNEIHDSVPRMSSALLSRRLRELEHHGIVERHPAAAGHGGEYRLTMAGKELFPVLEAMGLWSQKWLRPEITRNRNLDPYLVMWEIRRAVRSGGRTTGERRVAMFHLSGVEIAKRFYWLVFEAGDVDICTRDPGHEVDLWITAQVRVLIEVWLGHRTLSAALEKGELTLDGTPSEIAAFRAWFVRSHFARFPDRAGQA